MDFNAKEFYYPFSWKKPLIYIILCIGIGLYIVIFFVYREKETFGLIYATKGVKIVISVFFTTLLFHFFRYSPFVQRVESVFLRSLLLIAACFITLFFMMPAWNFKEYDNHKMNTYWRALPFKNAPYFKVKETLVFSTINTVKYISGVDTVGNLTFYLNNGKSQSIVPANISRKSIDIFLVTLCQECNWLQNDIEEMFGTIEAAKKRIENDDYFHFDLLHMIFFILLIWMFLVQIICLLIFTFKRNK